MNEIITLKAKTIGMAKDIKDKIDFVDILENTVRIKTEELVSLKEELEYLRKTQSPCIFCDFKTENDEELRKHVRKMHEWKCKTCDLAFEHHRKLKDHTCKINIRNPTQGNCYLKNWILAKGCTPVYCNGQKKEIATLHFEDCWRHINSCSELQPLNQHDENSVFHGKVSNFVRNGLVNWSDLMTELN